MRRTNDSIPKDTPGGYKIPKRPELDKVKAITTKEIEARTEKLMKDSKVSCDRGGCQFHSGHEYCSIDAAWEAYYKEAKEALERERFGAA